MNNDIAISVKNLSKRYFLQHPVQDEHGHKTNELWALKDVSFDIKKGESVGIIGPNGSGKTTLLKILAGITKPTSGSVEINGRVASILDIGAGFHPELSGRENVFLNGQLYGFSKKDIEQQVAHIVEFSGIGRYINEPIKNYSNGMFLRLAFSVLIHLDFDIYLFDEVVNVGDDDFSNKLKNRIGLLSKEENKTFVLVSHNTTLLSSLCNIYLIAEKGRIRFFDFNTSPTNCNELKGGKKTDKIECDGYRILSISFCNSNGYSKSVFRNSESIVLKVCVQNQKRDSKFPFLFQIVDSYQNSLICTSVLLQDPEYSISEIKDYETLKVSLPSNFFNEGFFSLNIYSHKNGDITMLKKYLYSFQVKIEDYAKVKWTSKIPTGILLNLNWEIDG